MRIFLGITGASGAPYAARLVEALAAADCELGLCISRAGYEVLATELYRDVSLPQDEIAQRLIGGADGVTIYSERDWKSPYASGCEGRRLRHLPVLDGHAWDDRLRRDVEPDPSRRQRGAEGGAAADRLPARDAAVAHP